MARLLSTLAIAAAVALSPVAFAAAAESIAWTNDFRAAQQQAGREGKLVLLHFYSDNCPPCRKLEQNVFPQAAVAAAVARNYVPVKVHVERVPDLARRYNIEAWPTDLIVTSAGLEVFRTISPQSVAQYQTMLDQVAFQVGLGAGRPNNAQSPDDRSTEGADVALTGGAQWQPAQDAAAPSGEVSNPYVHSGAPRPGIASQRPNHRPATTPPAPAQPSGQVAMGHGPGQQPQDSVYAPQPSAYDPQSSVYAPAVQPPPARTAPQQPAPQAQPPVEQTWQPQASAPRATSDSIYGGGSIYDLGAQQQPRPSVDAQNRVPTAAPPAVSQTQTVAPEGYVPPQQPAPQVQPNRRASARSEQRFVDARQAPRVALDGFCPVTILEAKRWQRGNVRFGAVHRNRTYLFANDEAQKKFLSDPDRYAPFLYGCDPVIFAETNQLIDGNHNIGIITTRDKMIFFTSEESLQRFKRAPRAYSLRASEAMSSGIVPPR